MNTQKYFRFGAGVIIFGAVIWLLISLAVRFSVNSIVFYPLKNYYTYPGIPQYTQYFLSSSQLSKVDTRYYQGTKQDKIILYFHGNAGLSTLYLRDLIQQGNVLAPSYPGYLDSSGEPTVENILEIGDLAYQKALDLGYREDQIILWGHSLGGSVATYLSARHANLNKTILVNTFNNLKSECEYRLSPVFCVFGDGLLASDKYAANVQGKIRQFHDKDDKTVPFELGQKMYESIGSKDKKFIVIDGDHNEFDIAQTFVD